MEEDRIGMMYLNLLKRRVMSLWGSLFPRGLARSRWLPVLVIALFILVPGILWRMHQWGRFSKLKRDLKTEIQPGTPAASTPGRPGGADPMVLTRKRTAGSDSPEFVSATLLPGLGMSVLQISAYLPGKGDTPLLMGPSIDALADGTVPPPAMVGDSHGAFEVPWGGTLNGTTSPLGTSLSTIWNGRAIEVPIDAAALRDVAFGGVLGSLAADNSGADNIPGGMEATAFFRGATEGDRWPSHTDVSVSVQMTGRTMNLTVQAKNTGDQAEPMGIGWEPRFSLQGSHRASVQLLLPEGQRLEISDRGRAVPTGKLLPGGRFDGHTAALGEAGVDETLTALKPSAGSTAPAAELLNPEAGYGLRITAGSETIRAVEVRSPADAPYVVLGMQTNLDDPFGKEWPEGQGIATLQPGQTLEWRLRLEIFSLKRP